MKKLVFILVILCSISSLGQNKDSINLKIDHPKSSDFNDLLSFEKIDFRKIMLYGGNLKGKSFIIVAKEYWEGKLTKEDTIVNSSKMVVRKTITSDTLKINYIAKKKTLDSLRVNFNILQHFGIPRTFKVSKSKMYSTRDLSNGKNIKFSTGQSFPLLVYSLPYVDPKRPKYGFYCELTAGGIPPNKWGEHYDIEHYIVFELIIK